MDVKYMMLKNRYKFEYREHSFLFDIKNIDAIQREISLFNNELTIYNIPLNSLSYERVNPIVKDELLNIAVICHENGNFSSKININRCLPIKELCSFTKHSQRYFEKWQNYILSFYLIFSNNYNNILSYLSIKKENKFITDDKEEIESPKVSSDINTGLVIKVVGNHCFVITPYGDFLKLFTTEEKIIGNVCSGVIKKDKDRIALFSKIIITFIIITSIIAYFFITVPKRTVVIKSNFSIKIQLDRFDRVISIMPENTKGIEIINSTKFKYKSLDVALLTILEKAKSINYINDSTTVYIYISSKKNTSPNLSQTTKYIENNKIKTTINNNGKE